MKNPISYLLLFTIFVACESRPSQDEDVDTTAVDTSDTMDTSATNEKDSVYSWMVEKMWETDTLMTTSESVLYDKKHDRIYVSNINGDPSDKDGNGFISSLTPDGKALELYFFSGYLDAPKGMALKGDKLYVSNIDQLVEIDVKTRFPSATWKIDTAKFLNDVAVGPNGTIYFSDSRTNTIYSLKDKKINVFLHSSQLNGPNGISVTDTVMYVTTMNGGQVLKINMDDKSINEMATGIGAGDGIVPIGDGRFLASSWSGKVFLIEKDGSTKTLINTEVDKINAADIEYVQDQNMLLVPTFRGNRVVAYKLKPENKNEKQTDL